MSVDLPALSARFLPSVAGAKDELHWAAQLIAAFGDAHVERRDDDSQSNFEVQVREEPARLRFVGRASATSPHYRAALEPVTGRLVLEEGGGGTERASLSLAGHTLEEGLDWLATVLARETEKGKVALVLRDYDMPAHPVASGAPLELAREEGLLEIARWFGLARSVLGQTVAGRHEATAIACWPHHFDLATLLTLQQGQAVIGASSVGVGFLLGDSHYKEPYFYVNCWPAPEAPPEEVLASEGHWHLEGFFAAVLPASRILKVSGGEAQRQRVEAFISSALHALGVV